MKKVVDTMARIDEFRAAIAGKYGKALYAEYGRKYCKLTTGHSVWAFIDIANGDVLKAASFAQPVKKNPRSNIFSEDFGLSGVNEYGANYLK